MSINNEEFDLKRGLIENSVEAYVLALETVNRLTVKYRVETFSFLMCNAWELLLKARIIDTEGDVESIYNNTNDTGRKRSISLKDCLNKTMNNKNDPVRRNLERIIELRDESIHLMIKQIPADLISLFQANVINYHEYLNNWFQRSLSDLFPIPMMSIVYDINPEQFDLSDSRLRRQLGTDAFDFLSSFSAKLRDEHNQLNNSKQFSININYRVSIEKKEGDADIRLTNADDSNKLVNVMEVPKDSSKTHPFRQTELIENLKKAGLEINQHDIQCVNQVFNIKSRSEFFYQQNKIKGSPPQYSEKFLKWLIDRYEKDNEFFVKTRIKKKQFDKSS